MNKVQNEGDYRGSVLDSAAGMTRNEYPQAIVEMQAEEVYMKTETGGEWEALPEPFESITAYLVLIGKDGTMTKSAEQVRDVMKWSGKTFAELDDKDFSSIKIQFRVGKNTYNDNTTLQVSWINPFDADPTRSIKKLDKAALKNLDSKHGAALRAFGKKAPTKAAATPASTPKASKKSSGPPKKKTVEYTADAVWSRFQEANKDASEEDLCAVWEGVENNIDKDTEDYTSADWKSFEEGIAAAAS